MSERFIVETHDLNFGDIFGLPIKVIVGVFRSEESAQRYMAELEKEPDKFLLGYSIRKIVWED